MELKIKKSYTGLFFALAALFAIAIFFLVFYSIYDNNIKDRLNDALTSSTAVDANSNVTKILDSTGSAIGRFNIYFPLLMVGIFAFVLISALMFKSHPAFLFIGLIVLAVALILGAVYSNVYDRIAGTEQFSAADTQFNIMGLFLANLPVVIFILFVGIAIVLYVLPKTGGGGANI